VPPDLHFSESPREGDPVVIAHGPYRILVHGAATTDEETDNRHIGGHGFDPAIVPQMKAIFFAAGPDIRSGITLPPFENVNIYPFVARILGLVAPPSDGKLEVLAPALHGTFPPILVLAVDPQYTPAARQAKINGKVTVNFQVELDGSTSHVRVLHGLDSGLDQSAVEAVKKYRFKPATRDGIPIVVQLNAVVEFKIF
jgi:TonB family protein